MRIEARRPAIASKITAKKTRPVKTSRPLGIFRARSTVTSVMAPGIETKISRTHENRAYHAFVARLFLTVRAPKQLIGENVCPALE